jgi:uncharacterized protein YciI
MAEISREQVRERVARGKRYSLLLLKAGPNRDMDAEQAKRIQIEHVQYLFGLIEDGVILINGPLPDHDTIRGISIYKSDDVEEVARIAAGDPAVRAGRLVVEVHPWFSVPGATLA